MIYKNIISLFHVLVITAILNSVIASATCDLKRLDRWLTGMENSVYLQRKELEKTIYRGISMVKRDALNEAFKDIKNKRCPNIGELRELGK